jgi:hypothetical protein
MKVARGLMKDPGLKSDDSVEGLFAVAILSLCHMNGITNIDAILRASSRITGIAFDAVADEVRAAAEAN